MINREPVDVLVVCTSSTPGNRRSELELISALRDIGVSVGIASTNYGWIDRLPLSLNLMDITRAFSNRLATTRALRSLAPGALLYGTGGAALLEPAERLSRGGVRFDSLAVDNRRGLRHVIQRALERRMVRHAALLLPFSSSSTWPQLARNHGRAPIPLPTPVEPTLRPQGESSRQPIVVCYGGAPEKKRLDVLIGAWAIADLPSPYRLIVTGITSSEGRQWLRRRRIEEPLRVTWAGHLDSHTYRHLTSSAAVYLSASRYEDYGIAQLEALADGALLVTTASPGPYEALALARSLNPGLVAEEASAEHLGSALTAAVRLSENEQAAYRQRASGLLAPYSRSMFRERLRSEVLPLLLPQAQDL